ncbi:VPS4-associated protein 1 [Abortiporus biennis]|nr:VPS4-associated protein 1 [Abortiporus biennis]
MSFTNLYYKRAVGTAKACYVCYKPTTTVLATLNTVDFIYVCNSHLSDPGFATQVGESHDGVGAGGAKKLGLSPEEIAKVKEEWEERQKKKQEREKEKKKKDNEDNKDEGDAKQEKDADKKSPTSKSPASSSTPSPQPATPTHERYTLHRNIFSLRLAEHRRRRQAAQAKELAPRLPGAPRGPLPSS